MKQFIFKYRFIFFPLAAIAFVSLVGFTVMQLWNHLLPEIFGITTITFWQAIGLFILCKILFGFGKGGRGGPPWMKRRMAERFKQMDPEEREKFKAEMKERMCGWGNEQ